MFYVDFYLKKRKIKVNDIWKESGSIHFFVINLWVGALRNGEWLKKIFIWTFEIEGLFILALFSIWLLLKITAKVFF